MIERARSAAAQDFGYLRGVLEHVTVEQVADVIADAIEHPVAEVYTNPASAEMARRYFADVGAYEAQSGNPWASAPGGTR